MLLSGEAGMDLLNRIFHGFGVRHPYRCTTGERAMEVCHEADLDMIVCDGSLPDGEAYNFISALRRSDLEPNRFTPVLVVAGQRDEGAGDPEGLSRIFGHAFGITVPGCDHFSAIPHALTKAAVFDFLDGLIGEDEFPPFE